MPVCLEHSTEQDARAAVNMPYNSALQQGSNAIQQCNTTVHYSKETQHINMLKFDISSGLPMHCLTEHSDPPVVVGVGCHIALLDVSCKLAELGNVDGELPEPPPLLPEVEGQC